eukprot:4599675-Pyramimonas_sp.AAC.1
MLARPATHSRDRAGWPRASLSPNMIWMRSRKTVQPRNAGSGVGDDDLQLRPRRASEAQVAIKPRVALSIWCSCLGPVA